MQDEAEALKFIDEAIRESGVAPSYDEICDFLGLKSKSRVFRIIRSLEATGRIRRLRNRARAIEVVRSPVAPPVLPVGLVNVGDYGDIEHITPLVNFRRRGLARVMASMAPLEALCFLITVRTDVMRPAGILRGDRAIFRRGARPAAGDIVLSIAGGDILFQRHLADRNGQVCLGVLSGVMRRVEDPLSPGATAA